MSSTAGRTYTSPFPSHQSMHLNSMATFDPEVEESNHSQCDYNMFVDQSLLSNDNHDILQYDLPQEPPLSESVGMHQTPTSEAHTNSYYQEVRAEHRLSEELPTTEPELSKSEASGGSPSSESPISSLPAGDDIMMNEDTAVKNEDPDFLTRGMDILNDDDAAMERFFNFDSTTSNPSALAGSSSMNHIAHSPIHLTNCGSSMMANSSSHSRNTSSLSEQNSAGLTMNPTLASRESSYYNSESPPSASGFDPMLSGISPDLPWPASFTQLPPYDPSLFSASSLSPNITVSPLESTIATTELHGLNINSEAPQQNIKPELTIHPTVPKSRVETQIAIKMTLYPMPPGVAKLHLPAHHISKAKLQCHPPAQKSPDMLELTAMLVCTSAIKDPSIRQRVLERAAGRLTAETKQPADEEDTPLNGGEVRICDGCKVRERKRADRKKSKNPEEEEAWQQTEDERVIVFNTPEIREWQRPTPSKVALPAKSSPLTVPEGAMQIDAPMRIACYCRHQGEKLGFNVIFTLKDHEDNLIAQAITNDIVITDDHKTPDNKISDDKTSDDKSSDDKAPQNPPLSAESSNVGDNVQPSDQAAFAHGLPCDLTSNSANGANSFRHSYSANDLQNIQHNFVPQFMHAPQSNISSQVASRNNSQTHMPRNLSRPASPSGSSGPVAKRRRANGPGRVPNGLMMTPSNAANLPPTSHMPPNTANVFIPPLSTSGNHNLTPYTSPIEQPYFAPPHSRPLVPETAPPTPVSNGGGPFDSGHRSQSMENIPRDIFYSAPNSAHPSRAPSPNSLSRNSQFFYQQATAQFPQAVANRLYNAPPMVDPHRPPLIHKIIPSKGPTAGGIEVTCLGRGFIQGMELMFGDQIATTTTFWGDSSLCALLPPAAHAGPVSVTLMYEGQRLPTPPTSNQQPMFNYVDDSADELMKLALVIVGNKMNGQLQDVGSIAQSIVQDNSLWSPPGSTHDQGSSQHHQTASLNLSMLGSMDIEANLIKCLELIDLDESLHPPRLSLRKSNGQTMLMLASSLGMSRFVAGLIARGVNPDARDKSGFTALHFASLHARSQIVRRLLLGRADPTIKCVRGYRPIDMASSIEVLETLQNFERQTVLRGARARPLTRPRSVTSLKSLWLSPSPRLRDSGRSDTTDLGGAEMNDSDTEPPGMECWTRSQRSSRRSSNHTLPMDAEDAPQNANGHPGSRSPAAARFAWRGQLANQIQNFQQNVPWNLPNLQIPALPPMPNLPHYQTSPMVRRISSLVPHRFPMRPSTSSRPPPPGTDSEYHWWDLFSASPPPPPPAYDEIFPQSKDSDLDMKKTSAVRAAADAALDQKYTEEAEQAVAASSSIVAHKEPIVGVKSLTKEEQEQLRTAHAKKVKRIQSDRNLFFIWLPLLAFIVFAMLRNWVPDILNVASKSAALVQQLFGERLLEAV